MALSKACSTVQQGADTPATLDAALAVVAEWQHHYNYAPPHSALGRLPPAIFAQTAAPERE
jgi:transposase InsO family protein